MGRNYLSMSILKEYALIELIILKIQNLDVLISL